MIIEELRDVNARLTTVNKKYATKMAEMKAVAVHEIFHGADMDHVYQSGAVMFHSYSYYDCGSLSDD